MDQGENRINDDYLFFLRWEIWRYLLLRSGRLREWQTLEPGNRTGCAYLIDKTYEHMKRAVKYVSLEFRVKLGMEIKVWRSLIDKRDGIKGHRKDKRAQEWTLSHLSIYGKVRYEDGNCAARDGGVRVKGGGPIRKEKREGILVRYEAEKQSIMSKKVRKEGVNRQVKDWWWFLVSSFEWN